MKLVIKYESESKTVQDTPDHDAMVAKIVAMCVLFATSFSLGTIPIKLSKWFKWNSDARNNIYIQILLCIGGGVLLCTTFLHLLPEVREGIGNSFVELGFIQDSLAELLMCTGFFVMYFVEEVVHVYLHIREKNNLNVLRRTISIRRGARDLQPNEDIVNNIEGHHTNHQSSTAHTGHSHVVIEEDSVILTLRGLLIVLALAIHELFEGLAVGLESSSQNVWYMFGAVSAHKLVIAFCIGVELVTSKMRALLVVIYIFIFAIVSPIGIAIGIGLSEAGASNADVPSVILQGLATGTLLYVVFFEVLSADRKSGLKQYFSVLFGFLIMFGLSMID